MSRLRDDDVALDFVVDGSGHSTGGASTPRRRTSATPETFSSVTIPLIGSPGRPLPSAVDRSWLAGVQDAASRNKAGLPLSKLRGSKLRWAVILILLTAVILWEPESKPDAAIRNEEFGEDDFTEEVPFGRAPPVFDAHPPIPQRPAPLPKPPESRPQPVEAVVAVPVVHQAGPEPATAAAASASDSQAAPIDVDVGASARTGSSRPPTGRYLTYLPHSGYHNQRISLENALTLAYMLDRTLLVPPVWVGHAIPYVSFDKLQRRLEMANKRGLEHCVAYGDGSNDEPIPHECDGFWDWTTVDWSFLVDLSEAEKLVPIKSRTDLSMNWLAKELELASPAADGSRPDVYELKDDTMYEYRFYDSLEDAEPLDKWKNRVDLDAFRKETDAYKLVQVGSLFGTSRIRVTLDKHADPRTTFRKAMVFRTEAVDVVVDEIRDQLGGPGKYYGLHLRVGDGIFLSEAKKNMRDIWEKLCAGKMKVEQATCDELRQRTEARRQKRHAEATTLTKRANSRPQREGAYHHAPLPPLPVIRSRADALLAPQLTCRGPLHTEDRFLPFNAPLFIATDSKIPEADPNLAVFFAAFPCTFTLADFADLPALGRVKRLRSAQDKTPLAQFLYPQLDAQVAAWGRSLLGTPQSTYSRFASDVLHQVYHGWEIIERG
ncbi:hypothetical protein BMF94_6268 [Rhodotorula taiwanensis]|uniref:O-fucosyltransferase family protein n=1 Tax=Rhodotorula taiwanensis TaxID=741276 RepID=A0A2S5B254_9BASI|nr:hypothetical protein BMF94_6268 [Rhodotorula taiwanensis]